MTVSATIPPIEQKSPPNSVSWRRTLRVGLFLYWLALALATHWPVIPDLRQFHTTDKQVHYYCYGLLAAMLAFAFGPSLNCRISQRLSRWAFLLAIPPLYGALDELTQPWTGRTCEWLDWVADVSGASTAMLGAILLTELARTFVGSKTVV